MAGQSIPLFNTDPNIQAQAALIQQRQAIAQALLSEGMKPLDTSNRAIGGVAYHVSPFEGLAKMLQAYSGQQGIQSAVGDQANLAAQAYGNLLSKYGTTQPTYSQDQISAADSGAMGADGYGPPDPQKVAAALMGQQPAQQSVNPSNPQNIPAPILASHDAGMINDETFKALTAPYAPTDATKAATQGGFNPAAANAQSFSKSMTDPKIYAMQQAGFTPQQIYAAQLGEAAKAAEIDRKPGAGFVNPVLGQNGVQPHLPPNANPVGAPGPNGALPGVAPIPGAATVLRGSAAAGQAGTTDEALRDVTLPDGSVAPVRGRQIGPSGTLNPDRDQVAIYQGELSAAKDRLSRLQAMSNADPTLVKRAQDDVDGLTKEMTRLRIPLGQSTAGKQVQEESGKNFAALPQQISQTKQTITGLENALNTLQQLKTSGPGVSKGVNALAIVNNMGIPLMKGDVNGFQTLKKYIENAASSAASSGGFTGSDARFEQFKSGQPNAETMNAGALEGALRYVLSQQDAALNRANFIAGQAGGNASTMQPLSQKWSQQYNPRYFEIQRLTPTEQATAVSKMSPQEAAAFMAWRKAQRGG